MAERAAEGTRRKVRVTGQKVMPTQSHTHSTRSPDEPHGPLRVKAELERNKRAREGLTEATVAAAARGVSSRR